MSGQQDLFSEPAPAVSEEAAPLASRLRPSTLEEVVGQTEVVKTLGELAQRGKLPSLIFWGPPGSGKTTLARILAQMGGRRLIQISAVTDKVADLRRALEEAALARRRGVAAVLFIDEIHRFNKAQQDVILPALEEGAVTLIGATTENPSFEVNSPLLSRSRVIRLQPLADEEVDRIVERGLAALGGVVTDAGRASLIRLSAGDARRALNTLEVASALAAGEAVEAVHVERAAQSAHRLYDRAGDQHYDLVSALIKSIRGSDPQAAVYWLARMLEAGEEVDFVARRLVILAAEDVGLADAAALPLAVAAQQASHLVGMPEAFHMLTEAAIYLALAPKSNSAKLAYGRAVEAIAEQGDLPVPLHLRNAPTALMRGMGYGKGYLYDHDFEGGVAPQEHLPEGLRGRRFYQPSPRDRRPSAES